MIGKVMSNNQYAKYVPCPNGCGHLKSAPAKECKHCSAKRKGQITKERYENKQLANSTN